MGLSPHANRMAAVAPGILLAFMARIKGWGWHNELSSCLFLLYGNKSLSSVPQQATFISLLIFGSMLTPSCKEFGRSDAPSFHPLYQEVGSGFGRENGFRIVVFWLYLEGSIWFFFHFIFSVLVIESPSWLLAFTNSK